jgi:hypothetical protein
MWRFVQDRSHGRNGGIRSFAAFPPNILNLNGKSGFRRLARMSTLQALLLPNRRHLQILIANQRVFLGIGGNVCR